jgi:hypothetical protein
MAPDIMGARSLEPKKPAPHVRQMRTMLLQHIEDNDLILVEVK